MSSENVITRVFVIVCSFGFLFKCFLSVHKFNVFKISSPLCLSLWISLWVILLNLCSLEIVGKYLFYFTFANCCFVDGGWYDIKCTYSCLLVSLMCVVRSRIQGCHNF